MSDDILLGQITDMISSKFPHMIGKVLVTDTGNEILVCACSFNLKGFSEMKKHMQGAFESAPLVFLEGLSSKITDKEMVDAVIKVLEDLKGTYNLQVEVGTPGVKVSVSGDISAETTRGIKKALSVFGNDGKFRRVIVLWGDTGETSFLEYNKPGAAPQPRECRELQDKDRLREYDITPADISDLIVLVEASRSFDEVLQAMDKAGSLNGN